MTRDYLMLSPDLPGAAESAWLSGSAPREYPMLEGDLSAEVAVVGGGLLGVLTALNLAEKGVQVALLEARRIGADVTGHTTAKVTAQHGLMAQRIGGTEAEQYLRANAEAPDGYEALVSRYDLDCGFARTDSHVYVTSHDEAEHLDDEADLYRRCGLEGGVVAAEELPDGAAGAVRLARQAMFDPVAFIDGAMCALETLGVRVFERSQARSLAENDGRVELGFDAGRVQAGGVVLATHVPVFDTISFSTRLFQYRTYAALAELVALPPAGMWYGESRDAIAWRPVVPGDPSQQVISGVSHKAGHGHDERDSYRHLFELIERRFPGATIRNHWSTQDCYSPDGLPYVGPSLARDHVWVGSGFCGWGMTGAWVAADVLCRLAMGESHPLADLLHTNRIGGTRPFFSFLKENVDTLGDYLRGVTSDGEAHPAEVGPLDGELMRMGGKHAAVWRGPDEKLHVSDAHCTHLRCVVTFNEAEQTWDCPCHGSRFLGNGSWVHGPARAGLEPLKTPREEEEFSAVQEERGPS